MEISLLNSILLQNGLDGQISSQVQHVLQFNMRNLEGGMKYLGYFINPNDYRKSHWMWLIKKVEKK